MQARHLRAVRAAAERETSLIEQVVAPTLRQRQPAARQQAGQTAREIAALSLRLHRALLEAALAEAGFAGDGLPDALSGAGAQGTGGLGTGGLGTGRQGTSGPGTGQGISADRPGFGASGSGFAADRHGSARRDDREIGGASA